MKTMVKFYEHEKAMYWGIRKEQRRGWEVAETRIDEQGYGCFKTGCFGSLFLPLALLGKKPNRYMVRFVKR